MKATKAFVIAIALLVLLAVSLGGVAPVLPVATKPRDGSHTLLLKLRRNPTHNCSDSGGAGRAASACGPDASVSADNNTLTASFDHQGRPGSGNSNPSALTQVGKDW